MEFTEELAYCEQSFSPKWVKDTKQEAMDQNKDKQDDFSSFKS
jgi:hypothetical protein